MTAKKNNTITLEQFKDKHYGKPGTSRRNKLDVGYENFKAAIFVPKLGTKKN